ncbi:MAG: tRNA dihydrouridine synthase DusB [Pseudomonadales bacterium]|nr:tRNA dihydrouridine synthase DusB [Pseudomonadales bacterium]
MLSIGPYSHSSRVIVAPMAGVTDQPFRNLCRQFGANWLVSEMVTSDIKLWRSRKSQQRLRFHDEKEPRWIQIAGADPGMMAEAAAENVAKGAQIIDINMGCPAKKVCNKLAGSSLMRDEKLVVEILETVVSAVQVPVTLKMRLGWSRDQVNAVNIAKIAEQSGIQLLSVHGRTRADRFEGVVDYDAIGLVKQSVTIPVIGNGDITSAEFAKSLMQKYSLDGVMLGRSVQGRPWFAAEVDAYLNGNEYRVPDRAEIIETLCRHLVALSDFYGEITGVRVARKHVGWYLSYLCESNEKRAYFNQLNSLHSQLAYIRGESLAA